MSSRTGQTTADQLPHVPETQVIEPVVQCGVLYLGTAVPSPGRRGLDSIQEPMAHRYPVDGTNTARGIDSVLSIFDNGIQLTFARQPHTVIFFPISSLIYCASLRFSIVENDQTASIDWRFVTLDSTINYPSKHPPLFCAVVQRTQILKGDECHCFITKSDDAALALVRTISEVYASLSLNIRPLRAPIFYQLDRYGRKLSETTGVIYLSPATEDESDRNSSMPSISRNCLLDPSMDGFFYRTDGNIIEQWQLWDDDDLTGSRPRPPPSPFGQHQALYHDDLTQEIHHYLRRMDDEEYLSSCSCSSSSSSSKKSSRHRHRRRRRQKSKYDNSDPLNRSFSQTHTSSFDPTVPVAQNNIELRKTQPAPIIIEKVVPKPVVTIPQKYPIHMQQQPQQSFHHSVPAQETTTSYPPYSDTYQINERGEKITTEGNRILYMDVIQPTAPNNAIPSVPYMTEKVRTRPRRRRSKQIPVIDLESVEKLFQEKKFQQRRTSLHDDDDRDHQITTSDMLEIVEEYFEDFNGRKMKSDGHEAQAMLDQLESSSDKGKRRSKSSHKTTHHRRRRQNYSTINAGPSVNYVERSFLKSPSQQAPSEKRSISNHDQVNEYVSNVYGTPVKGAQSIVSSASHHETDPSNTNNTSAMMDETFISPFRYMQSSMNPLLLREYRHAFTGV